MAAAGPRGTLAAMRNCCSRQAFLRATAVLLAAACASSGVAQTLCTTAAVPLENLVIEGFARANISGERCTAPGDRCEAVINLATVNGECQTETFVFFDRFLMLVNYNCACSYAKVHASGSLSGQGTASTLDTFGPGAVLSYTLDRPIVVEIVDCNYSPEPVHAVLSSLAITVQITNDTVDLVDPPGPQHGILVTSLSATMAPVTVCGQDWGVSFIQLDPAQTLVALGFVDVATGLIEFPVNLGATVVNDVHGAGSPLLIYGFLGGSVDVAVTNGLTFVLSLNPELDVHPADLDVDGNIGITDFLLLLANWGPCPTPCPPTCGADINGDCDVDVVDFLALLSAWGPVP